MNMLRSLRVATFAAITLLALAIDLAYVMEVNAEAQTSADAAALAGILDGLERYDESEPIYRRALAAFEQIYGPEHYEIAVNLNNLANVRYARGAMAEAEALLRRALAMKEHILGRQHPDTALTVNNLGVLLQSAGKRAEARRLFRRALKTFQRVLGENHPKTQMVRENLASLDS